MAHNPKLTDELEILLSLSRMQFNFSKGMGDFKDMHSIKQPKTNKCVGVFLKLCFRS
jgi:hypothetical protein